MTSFRRELIIYRQPSAQTMGADESTGDKEMFKSWVKRKVNDVGSKSSVKDLQRVVVMLKGMSDDELAALVSLSHALRENMRETSGIDIAYHLSDFDNPECGEAWVHVRNMVRHCQAKEMFEASAALMVWLHSIRAMHYLECRYYGQQMWSELLRGTRALQAAGESIDDYFFPADLIDFDTTATTGRQAGVM